MLSQRIIHFNKTTHYDGYLPEGIKIMNPYLNPVALEASSRFYNKYYADDNKRVFILGINPGRFGSGLTGVSFTDPKRLQEYCGIDTTLDRKHEPSSEFIYNMITAYGGVAEFYATYYIQSVCPLGFTSLNSKANHINYNYYDLKELYTAVKPFIVQSLRQQIALGLYTDTVVCLGTGKNYEYLSRINDEFQLFKKILPVEHPRFIKQYKAKSEHLYIERYLETFKAIEAGL